jgi:hypothetical protein
VKFVILTKKYGWHNANQTFMKLRVADGDVGVDCYSGVSLVHMCLPFVVPAPGACSRGIERQHMGEAEVVFEGKLADDLTSPLEDADAVVAPALVSIRMRRLAFTMKPGLTPVYIITGIDNTFEPVTASVDGPPEAEPPASDDNAGSDGPDGDGSPAAKRPRKDLVDEFLSEFDGSGTEGEASDEDVKAIHEILQGLAREDDPNVAHMFMGRRNQSPTRRKRMMTRTSILRSSSRSCEHVRRRRKKR